MKKNYITYDSDSEINAIYDESGNLIELWQDGDDISGVLRRVFEKMEISLVQKPSLTLDGAGAAKNIQI